MPLFNIFHITEHVFGSFSETDNKIIILYDESDGNYYYYGTRNNKNQNKYIMFSGKYHYTKLNDFVQFLEFLMNGFISHLTTELHQIYIDTYQYDTLNYNILNSKLSTSTELSAYDKKKESYDNIYNYLRTLITHES
jgi:hypothetical protein